ncbi:hypothetical protein NE237_027509 [Protea cynaroides]|uniref:Uncharacterized protein n=1 Tax=Protea cynaroides TaxID=273540 RepID=A0A9Q0GMN3_9MAGN|nr:hypothetical protein NE237_027509 [Protea cynaroides]
MQVSFSRHLRLPRSKPSSDTGGLLQEMHKASKEQAFVRYGRSPSGGNDCALILGMHGTFLKTYTMVHAVKALLTRDSVKEEAWKKNEEGSQAYSNVNVVFKLRGWDPDYSKTVAQASLSDLKMLTLSHKKLPEPAVEFQGSCVSSGDWNNSGAIKQPSPFSRFWTTPSTTYGLDEDLLELLDEEEDFNAVYEKHRTGDLSTALCTFKQCGYERALLLRDEW